SGHVDLVVTSPRASDDDEAVAGRFQGVTLHPGTQDDKPVQACQMPGRDFQRIEFIPVLAVARLWGLITQKVVLDVAGRIEQIQRQTAIGVYALLIEDIARNRQTKCAHATTLFA